MSVNNGGYAFPFAYETESTRFVSHGMTLRDYFAARAVQSEIREYGGIPTGNEHIFAIAKVSYQMADAMLKAREAT
jgi:hypothetical protein